MPDIPVLDIESVSQEIHTYVNFTVRSAPFSAISLQIKILSRDTYSDVIFLK